MRIKELKKSWLFRGIIIYIICNLLSSAYHAFKDKISYLSAFISSIKWTINISYKGLTFPAELWQTLLIIIIIYLLLKGYKKYKLPKWIKYTNDNIKGLNWQWQYDIKAKTPIIINLKALCSKCGCLLKYPEKYETGILRDSMDAAHPFTADRYKFKCSNCGNKYESNNKQPEDIENIIQYRLNIKNK